MMKQKMENYAASFIETIADKRHRNVEWAKSAVRRKRRPSPPKRRCN